MEHIANFVLPKSSTDLNIDRELVFAVASIREVLDRFGELLQLQPIWLEDLCTAVSTTNIQHHLLAEVHKKLLIVVLKNQLAFKTTLELIDDFTWPAVLGDYSAPHSIDGYPFVDQSKRVSVLNFLKLEFLRTEIVRRKLINEEAFRE